MASDANEQKKPDILAQLNSSFKDLVKNVFGQNGLEFINKTEKQVNELSAKAIKGFVDFSDNMIVSMKLDQNEMVKKSQNTVKDLLRQLKLLEEEKEDDF